MAFKRLALYYHTLRHLRITQIIALCKNRLLRLLPQKAPSHAPLPLSKAHGAWQQPPHRPASLDENHITLLHQSATIASIGKPWNIPEYSPLWNYHLHYHEDILGEGALSRRQIHKGWIAKWIEDNPAPSAIAWDAYPISRRASFWMMAAQTSPDLLDTASLANLAGQIRHLAHHLEYHLMGNHLLANAKTLYMAGLFFVGDEAKAWHDTGKKLLIKEASAQFLPDGGHEEKSPMYHALMLEDLLDAANMAIRYGDDWPPKLHEIICHALYYLNHVTHPDGSLARFNDSAGHMALTSAQLHDYAGRLGFEAKQPPQPSGYIRLNQGGWQVLLDADDAGAAHQPGHVHADSLSLEAYFDGCPILVNGGTSDYANPSQRQSERASLAHNCLVVDNIDSSEIWGNFRLGRRAEIIHRMATPHEAEATHNGYAKIIGNHILHKRMLAFDAETLMITDEVTGKGAHEIAQYWQLAPHCSVIRRDERLLILQPLSGRAIRLSATHPIMVSEGHFAPEFGCILPIHRLIIHSQTRLPAIMGISLSPL